MVTDHEAAWVELQEFISGKTQHGREGLLVKMAELAARHRAPAGELSRLLRLHGVEVAQREAMTHSEPDSTAGLGVGLASVPDLGRPAHHDQSGGHDGRGRAGTGGRG